MTKYVIKRNKQEVPFDIKKIKRANLISLVSKEITIKLGNGRVINLMVNNKEKALPYHEMEFTKFVNSHKN